MARALSQLSRRSTRLIDIAVVVLIFSALT